MSLKSLILIIAQFLFLGYIVLSGIITSNLFASAIQVIGLVIAIYGVLTLNIGNFNIQPEVRSSYLIMSGPYAYVRNPMYTGILCICIPAVIVYPTVSRVIILGCLIIVLLLKIQREERFLIERFGKDYADYARHTKRLIPFIF